MANYLYRVHSQKWPGVYAYDSDTRKVSGKPDVCYYITFKVDGKKHTEKIGWRSEGYSPQVAAELRAARVKDARHGKNVRTQKEIRRDRLVHDRTINEIGQAYFESPKGLSLKGRNTDLNRYDLHIRGSLGNRRASSIMELDIERLKRDMKGHASATISNTLELFRRIINYGSRNGLCPHLSFVIKLPKKNNEVTEYLTSEQAKSLQAVLESWPNQDVSRMLLLAMFTGMRRGEIFNLKWQHIDFHQSLIWLRDPKGGEDVSIPLASIVSELLREQLTWCEENHPESVYVFPAQHGGKRRDSSAVERIKEKACLPRNFRIFHGLRHHFGVSLANSGEYTLDMIGALLTHKSTAVTRRYAQFLPDTKRRAADRATKIIEDIMTLDEEIEGIKNKSIAS